MNTTPNVVANTLGQQLRFQYFSAYDIDVRSSEKEKDEVTRRMRTRRRAKKKKGQELSSRHEVGENLLLAEGEIESDTDKVEVDISSPSRGELERAVAELVSDIQLQPYLQDSRKPGHVIEFYKQQGSSRAVD